MDAGTVARARCADDPEALDLLDRASQNPVGTNVPINNVQTHEGNSVGAALRRLRKDRPDLHTEVLAGALTDYLKTPRRCALTVITC